MNERIQRSLQAVKDFKSLGQLERNVRGRVAFDEEIAAAFKRRAETIAREMIAERTGLDLRELTPAEEKIVGAVSEYLAIKKRDGRDATRTITQLRNRGLIESAETSVSKAKPTQGFETLREADLDEISYERIIIDHPEEFSPRAIWFARRTLGLPSESEKPPARRSIPAQLRTEQLLAWLEERASRGDGRIEPFSNAEAARAVGMEDMTRHGRVYGNIQSRLDFACYRLGLPPLGLTAESPFREAWRQEGHAWPFPISSMQVAAQAFLWRAHDFERLMTETEKLAGVAHVLWRAELRDNEGSVRAWAEGLESGRRESIPPDEVSSLPPAPSRNPDWTREEHLLGLDLYLRLRGTSYSDEDPEVIKLSKTLRKLADLRKMVGTETFRNANGVSMKMLNFRRVDPEYDGAGLPSGSQLEIEVWNEFADDPEKLGSIVDSIMYEIEMADGASYESEPKSAQYWVLVCNPAKWAIDKFLASAPASDTWGVRPYDAPKFGVGQLAIVRVGVDRRSAADRKGRAPLVPGIYAVCEIESSSFAGTGANDQYWAKDSGREPGWPTVRIRYLRNYLERPLSIERLRQEYPDLSPLLLNGFQAASFPIEAADFHAILELLGEDNETIVRAALDDEVTTLDRLAALESKFINASPEVKTRVGKSIERGPIGAEVKRANKYRCQLCEALGLESIGFKKKSGEPYVEAHHVMPVRLKEIGSLSATNIVTLCANHHREVHYGDVTVSIGDSEFTFVISGREVQIARARIELREDFVHQA